MLTVKLQQLQSQLQAPALKAKSLGQQVAKSSPWGYLSSIPVYILPASIAFLLLIIVYLLLFKVRQPKALAVQPVIQNDDTDTEQEYDFMGSKEAVPAKLDLARTCRYAGLSASQDRT